MAPPIGDFKGEMALSRANTNSRRRENVELGNDAGRARFAVTKLIVVFLLFASPHVAESRSLNLDQALGLAMKQSPTIRQAQYNLEVQELNLDAQNAALKSQFSLSVTPYSYSKDRQFYEPESKWLDQEDTESSLQFTVSQPIRWTDGTLSLVSNVRYLESSSDEIRFSSDGLGGPSTEAVSTSRTSYSSNLYLSLSQPLFTYNRTQLQLRELELALENARLNYSIRKLELESQVTQSFYDLYRMEQSVQISREELANTEESYGIIRNKVEAGISAEEELYQAELNLANSRASLESDLVNLANARDDFKIQLGIGLSESIEVMAEIDKFIVDVNLQKAIEKGLEYSLELQEHQISIENAQADLIRAGSQNEFRGTAELTYGLTGTDSELENLYDSPTKTQRVSLTLNIPLWDWGEKGARMEASRTQIESAELNRDEQIKQIELSIKKAYRNLINQETQVEIAEQNVRNAQLTYEINLERYRNGDISSKEIGEYQTQLSREKLNRIAALINYRIALLNLKIQSLWNFQSDTPVLDID